ncbi:Rhomboid protease GlpG [Paraglaciecola mesophila]|uniref:Rhomboid protease GlpG n=1 Tax=Paraglaciecola mesophila TaxID=197222 RepID=A0A857JL85_9ALTE|nr:rhomboid family intramembrane serine protease GlpG [Paraglaciecola mesophila]QHJ12296.1 Rhomboid protease GlpG [Paraglaciecola mesophila]
MSMPFLLVSFNQERAARLLTNYLNSQGIVAQYSFYSGEHAVQLLNESDKDVASNIANEFIQFPQDKKYQQAAWDSGQTVTLNDKSSGVSLSGMWQQLREIPVTTGILLTCLVVYLLAMVGFFWPYQVLAIEPFPQLLENHQWWRLIGPALIHFSVLHIVFNLLWWWTLGGQIERVLGRATLIMLFLFSALLSNIGQLLVSGEHFGGLSGVVYALVGCVWWLGWLRPSWGLMMPKPLIGFLLVWLVVGYADILWVSMANTAHTVGLISGCVFALILSRFTSEKREG